MTPKVTQKPYAENQILVVKVIFSRYPGQAVYCSDLKELHHVIDGIFIDDPEKFQTKPDYNFIGWVDAGEEVKIEMEFVSQEFLDKLEDFETF